MLISPLEASVYLPTSGKEDSSFPASLLAVTGSCVLADSHSGWDELESPSSLVCISCWLKMLNTSSNLHRPFVFLPLRAVSSVHSPTCLLDDGSGVEYLEFFAGGRY